MTQYTLKQAVERLAETPNNYKRPYIRKAIYDKRLKATLKEDVPSPYYVVEESDLLAWAETQGTSKAGNPNFRKKASEK